MASYVCKSCGTVTPKLRYRCRSCGSKEFDVVRSSRGVLLSFTEIHATRPGFQRPLKIGVVKLDSGAKVFGRLEITKPRIGARVTVYEGVGIVVREDG